LRVVAQRREAFEASFLRRERDGCAGLIDDLAASGSVKPAIIRISVDLPAPFAPTNAARSPLCSTNSAPSKSGAPPSVERAGL
jgi:hypothetical protein